MTTGKDTASFFENGTTYQFEYCFKLYPQVLKMKAEKRGKKPQELIRLDEWYQNELPKLIKERGKDAHMVYDELVQTMKWKQSRGKFYPQLSYLVKVNTPRAVIAETKKAFRKLPNLEQAITALSNLKGVGTTMASALLAAAAPNSAPFMADECLMAIPDIEGIDYTTKEYLNFVQHIQNTVTRLNNEAGGDIPTWSPHRVELALWAHYVANDLSPEMLDEMPGPGAGGGAANMNGSSSAKNVLDGNEDTNDVDADEESLGAAVARGGEANNTATESETENENTNPAPLAPVSAGVLQDGDSNFVSNDSTSQEPTIHDENTTQTTATTSTDDGDVGTPLASDSESNMEAPRQSLPTSTVTAAVEMIGHDAATVAPMLPNNTSNSGKAAPPAAASVVASASAGDAAVSANGNGNGTSLSVGDSLDGETSSTSNCLRRSPLNEEASVGYEDDEEDDEEEHVRMADESSNSCSNNSRSGQKSVTPIINLNDGTNNTNNTDDSTLSSAAGLAIGQKRALHHCAADIVGDDANSQPDMKKVRSD